MSEGSGSNSAATDVEMEEDDVNHKFYDTVEGDDGYGDVNKESSSSSTSNQKSDFRLAMVNWMVYEIVSAAADEFNGKFKKMLA